MKVLDATDVVKSYKRTTAAAALLWRTLLLFRSLGYFIRCS